LGIEMLIEWVFERSRGVVWNGSFSAFVGNGLADVVGVIGGVSNDNVGRRALQKWLSLWSIALLASREDEAHRTPQTTHCQVDLGAQAAARASDSLILSPPFAPLACW